MAQAIDIGIEGEVLFKDLLNKKEKLFFEIVQEKDNSFSKKLKKFGGKRPDFIVLKQESTEFLLVDVKNIKIQEYEYQNEFFNYFTLNEEELNKALRTEEISGKEFYFCIKDNKIKQEYFNWYLISASSIKKGLEDFKNNKIYKSVKTSNLINIKTTATYEIPNLLRINKP